MNEGTLYIVLRFPYPWPPSDDVQVLSRRQDDSIVSISASREGCLTFHATQSDQLVATYTSQRLRVLNAGFALLSVRWKAKAVDMQINGIRVKSIQEASSEQLLVETKELQLQDPPSINHPSAVLHAVATKGNMTIAVGQSGGTAVVVVGRR